jgi:hypothetical protein
MWGGCLQPRGALQYRVPDLTRRRDHGTAQRPHKITFGELRSTGVHGILIYCSDYKCSHSIAISADQWPDPTYSGLSTLAASA